MISFRLDKFLSKGNDLYNFRCPFCGDSQKSTNKRRGFIYKGKTSLTFKCHNCGDSMGFSNFLKKIDPNLHKEYMTEIFKEKYGNETVKKQKPKKDMTMVAPVFKSSNPVLKSLDKISNLDDDHVGRKYVLGRKIPKPYHSKLYYTDDFGSFVKQTRPDKHHTMMDRQERLIIPFFDEKEELVAYQGRVLGKTNQLRYITITFDDSKHVFGLDTLNKKKPIYVLEGPIDSMFVDNSVALAGSTKFVNFDPESTTFIFDNERRIKEIITIMQKRLHDGYGIFIWPDDIMLKDINELSMNGFSAPQIMDLINTNTHRGLTAEFKINTWKRI